MRDFFVIVFFIICYFLVFLPTKYYNHYKPLQGTIFDLESNKTTDNTEQPAAIDSKLPTLTIYSDLHLPDFFVAKKINSRSLADFILVSEKLLDEKFVFKFGSVPDPNIKKDTAVKIVKIKKDSTPIIKKKTEAKTPESISFNFPNINNIVKNSDSNFFYPDLKKSINDVILKLVSFTNYKNKGILKVEILNNTKQYFFVGTVNVSYKNDKIPCDFYGNSFTGPNTTLILYVLLRDISTKKELNLEIIESGGGKRCLKIEFYLP